MGILSWLLHTENPADTQNTQRISETVERVMRLHPHLRLARHYQARLAPAVATSLRYVGDLVDSVPAPREASAAAWTSDPYIHAYFAAADDVTRVISRSVDLRAHFEQNGDLPEAFAVLGMEMTERHIFGVGLEGEILRRDVPQTTVSFSDHQVRMCGRTDAELRIAIVRRLLDQLALEGLARIAADKSRRDMLERERALLNTRLRLLEQQGAGIRGVLGSDASTECGELARLQTQIEENEHNLESLGLREDALDRELEHVRKVFAEPGQHFYLSVKRLRLDRMNVEVGENSTQAGEDFEFHIARVPTTPPRVRAFSLVRFARADMLPAKSMLDEAARVLSSGLLS
ncbi:MAG: hypothetical protein V7606_3501 [Burkholderiales bacterium]